MLPEGIVSYRAQQFDVELVGEGQLVKLHAYFFSLQIVFRAFDGLYLYRSTVLQFLWLVRAEKDGFRMHQALM